MFRKLLRSNIFESQRVGEKNIWVNCSASPLASTNKFLIENISHVIEEMHRINVRYN